MTTVAGTADMKMTASIAELRNLRKETWGVTLPPGLTFDPTTLDIGYFEFSAIVNRAASAFERSHPFTIVTHNARQELIDRASAHTDDIRDALIANKLTPFDLENAAYKQFDEAIKTSDFIARVPSEGGSKFLTVDDILIAMRRVCWFVGWC
jgi:hypothetical protein